ncbi:MAG: hypothetical protein H7Z73_05385 [Candidatus Saccharibacteria bacterium]|nr:hypothetical protein [Moraxellaceae bacterium]
MNSDERKQQLREAQRRRREKLALGERSQVNIFLTQQCKELVDLWCYEYKTDRHNLINVLILAFSKDPKNIFQN